MSPLDEAPEQRWRRVVDRRNRPAKLKVDRLVRDFGYAALDDEVGDAIEARLAGVALAVAPSLRNAIAGEVVTIYANDSAASERGRRPVAEPPAVQPRPRECGPSVWFPPSRTAEAGARAGARRRRRRGADGELPQAAGARRARRVRAPAHRARDGIAAARTDVERDTEAIIVQQAAVMEEQDRQIAELGAALDATRQALADTRDEIRRAVGELQVAPESIAPEDEPPPLDAAGAAAPDVQAASADEVEQPDAEAGLRGEEPADGPDETEAAPPAAELPAAPLAPDAGDEIAPPAPAPRRHRCPARPTTQRATSMSRRSTSWSPCATSRNPRWTSRSPCATWRSPCATSRSPRSTLEGPAFDVDEPPLGIEEEPAAAVPPPEPAAAVPPPEPAAAVPPPEPAAAVAPPPPTPAGDGGDPQPDRAAPPDRSESNVTWLRERDAPRARRAAARRARPLRGPRRAAATVQRVAACRLPAAARRATGRRRGAPADG